ncbi:MAG TPA: hypothetical protein VGM52_03100 [Herbaspirillum sp.]|jgi:hypothetical protein
MLSAWDIRLIDVITNCEDDIKRYRDVIEQINGARDCNASILVCCMKNEHAQRHLALFTALHIVGLRFQKANCSAAQPVNEGLASATASLQQHIKLIAIMMRGLFSQMEQSLTPNGAGWDYGASILARLIERRLRIAIDNAIASLQEQFSCTLITVLMAAIEPAMKSVQDRLSLQPELPLDVKAFAGAMLGLKSNCNHGAQIELIDLASDVSQIFKIPRTICL